MGGMVGQFTPALKAGGDIAPYRFVSIEATGVDNQVIASPANDAQVIGISDGSNTSFDSAQHALTGEEVRIQPGTVLLIENGAGAVDAGDAIGPGAAGIAEVQTPTSAELYAYARALEDAPADVIFRVLWIGQVNLNTATS